MALLQTYRNLYNKYQASYGDDTCIFLLVGKFYELYDTINPQTDTSYTSMMRATQIMNIQVNKKETAEGYTLFAGIPEQSRDKFAQTLTSRGWTVVIVDQVKSGTKVTDRTTARILSPGTHVEMAGQERMSVAALTLQDNLYSTSVNDLTTGEVFSLVTDTADSVLHMFQIYNVCEVVAAMNDISNAKAQFGVKQIHQIPQSSESDSAREDYFRRMFKVKSLMPVKTHLSISEPVEKSLLYLLRFVEDHFPQQAERLTSHTMYNPGQHLRLANNIIEQLNIITSSSNKSVLDLVDTTHTAIGKRAMRERILRPITNPVELEERWIQVEWCMDKSNRDLKGMYDLPRLHFKIASANINAVDILQLFQSYGASSCLIKSLTNTPLACSQSLSKKISDYRTAFEAAFDEDKATKKAEGEVIGFLTGQAGPRTAVLEQKIQEIQATWKTALETFCKSANISPNLFTVEKKSDGYILEAPRNLHSALTAKKFTGGAINFTPILKKSGPLEISCDAFTTFCQSMLFAEVQLEKVLKEEFTPICDSLWDLLKELQPWIDWIGNVDCSLALASVAVKNRWCKPAIANSLEIKGLRHPLLESATHANARLEYIKHDVNLDDTQNGWLIYGVNASGKSSLMKATGIAVILAQAGSFVPATSMTLRPYDAAFSRIWTHDNIWAGLSSFAVEVAELSDILRLSTDRSLVLGDEVCSGTESSSATALVAATIESLEKKGTHFMFATHLHDLLKVKGFPRPGVAVWHLRVITQPDGKLIYDRSLQPGPGSATYGLEVAKAMGLPFELIQRAHEIRRGLEGITTVQDAPKSIYNAQIQRQACEVCKNPMASQLEVHHIEEQAKGGSNQLRNLIVVCESCHDKHHNGTIEISPLTQTSYGLERFSHSVEPVSPKPKVLANEELIREVIAKNRGKVPNRIRQILQVDHDIQVSELIIKRFL
jgi:DNA mismatch repair protein MutS